MDIINDPPTIHIEPKQPLTSAEQGLADLLVRIAQRIALTKLVQLPESALKKDGIPC